MFFLSRGWRSFWNWRRKSRSASETFIRCMNYGVREACQRWTQLRSKYSSNLKSTGVLEDVKQNIKEKTTFWLRKKKRNSQTQEQCLHTAGFSKEREGKAKLSWHQTAGGSSLDRPLQHMRCLPWPHPSVHGASSFTSNPSSLCGFVAESLGFSTS